MDIPKSLWDIPPAHSILNSDEVHVWRASLDTPQSHVRSLEQTLSADERRRAERFRFQKDSAHFIVTRGILRAILARYLARDPQSLQFHYNQYGKPSLVAEPGSDALSFNVTHSRAMALYAITHNQNIGIDLEYINTEIEYEQIAERFFSPKEVSMFRAVPQHMQAKAFFNCWTRKEAYVKARGIGLSLDLNKFDVSVTPGEPAAILSIREENQNVANWSLHDLYPDLAYAAALAVERRASKLICWQWSYQDLSLNLSRMPKRDR